MANKKSPKRKIKKNRKLKDFIDFFKNKKNQKVFGFLFLLFALYCFISFISSFFHWQEDFSEIKNKSWFLILSDPDIEIHNSLGKVGALHSYVCWIKS